MTNEELIAEGLREGEQARFVGQSDMNAGRRFATVGAPKLEELGGLILRLTDALEAATDLADHDRRIKAEAWDEGAIAGANWWNRTPGNPYSTPPTPPIGQYGKLEV